MTAYYIFISHGPNPRLQPTAYLETLRPWKNVMAFHGMFAGEAKREVYYDYARRVEGLSSVPKLRALLEASTERKAGFLTDDFRRIFSRCPLERRNVLHEEICELGDYFIDLRTRKAFNALSRDFRLTQVVFHQGPVNFRLEDRKEKGGPTSKGRLQTKRATKVSGIIRGKMADRKAEELAALRDELERENQAVTLIEIAEEANTRGILTTQGNSWSPATVQRALKRFDGTS